MTDRLAAVGIVVALAAGGSIAGATETSPDVESGERVFATSGTSATSSGREHHLA